jgi:hypothetical protein
MRVASPTTRFLETLHSATSCPFGMRSFGCIAVNVMNHLGDAVMKVFLVG